MSQIPNIRHEWLDKQNPRQVDPKWFLFLQQVAAGINGIPAQIDATGRQAQSPLLDRIAAQTGSGFLVVAGGSSVAVRTLQEGDGISITNPQGSAGDPVFSLEDLADSGIGDDGLVVLTRDDKGRIAGMAPATSADLAYVDTMHSLGLANAQEALDKALGALPYFSDTAPDPDVNPYWIDTTDLTPYVWYDDGTSAQWIALDALASLAASAVTYDNTTSGLTATNVQDAIDEIAALGGGGSYTDEQAQDAVGTILVDSSTIDFTYSDATPSITASVIDDSITYAKLQNVSAASRLIGRGSASGAGDPQEITLGAGLTMSGTSLVSTGGVGGVGMTLLGSATIAGSAASIITVSGLSLAAYKSFFVVFSFKNATASASNLSLQFNGDTTTANYARQGMTVANTGTSPTRGTDSIVDSLPASENAVGDIRIVADLDGRPRAYYTSVRDNAANITWRCAGIRWATAADVTSISLSSSVASAFAIGSRMDVYGNA